MKRVLLIIETSRSYGRGIMAGVSRFALEHGGWSIHFDDRGLLEEPPDWLRTWKGDGIISRTALPTLRRILSKKRCPLVELHGNGRTHFSEVRICDRTIGNMAADYFVDRGFIHFGFYSCGNPWWSEQRLQPFLETLGRRGFQCHVYSDKLDKRMMLHPVWENRFEKPLKKWLEKLPKPIAVWAITDHQAVRVLESCQDLGLHVPEDVAILGTSNDTLLCNLLSPPLSSIDVNSMSIGYEAARRLEMKMNGIEPDEPYVNIPPLQVVTRQSTDIIAIPDPDVAAALHLIREQAGSGITVARIVQELGLSRRSLERSFLKYLNRSPHDEIIRVRINNAKTLLQVTSLSISAIARRSGFTNRDYFITAFHRETGVTPHSYRTRQLNPTAFTGSAEAAEDVPARLGSAPRASAKEVHSIENDYLRSDISRHGAELQSIFGLQHGLEYLWQGDPRYWAHRAPVMFPIVGRVRDGLYRYRERNYSIESPHGFAKSLPFQVERHDSDSIRFVLNADRETLRQYPFQFRFAVEYALEGRSLRILFHVENRDDKIMPFSLGFHPAFRVPVQDGTFENHCLAFEEDERPEQWTLDGVFLSGDRVPFPLKRNRFLSLHRSLFENEAIILDGIRKKAVSLLNADRRPRWTMQFDDFRFLTLWQPAGTESPFLCLETWNGLPDLAAPDAESIIRKPAIRSLRPGKSCNTSLRIVFE